MNLPELLHSLDPLFDIFTKIWNFEIFAAGNSPITIKKILLAVIILVIGIRQTRILSKKLIGKLRVRYEIQYANAAVLENLLRYTATAMIFLFAFSVVDIPLAVFSFLGGAIAIGLGFGAQNILNNFISGIIVMAERPIKIGDRIEVDNNYGKVVDIGARSSRIRTPDGIEILIPNSSFLEKNVINWTHSDELIRASVTVGVAYGSPVNKVKEILLQIIDRHKEIVRDTATPEVLFTEFGDNALQFKVLFWIRMDTFLARQKIESDIRFEIDEHFRKNDICIAFPQRDVHLFSSKPINVRLEK